MSVFGFSCCAFLSWESVLIKSVVALPTKRLYACVPLSHPLLWCWEHDL